MQATKEDVEQVVEVPHIDFIFRDRPSFLEDCDPLVQNQELQPLMVRSHIQAKARHQTNGYVEPTFNWKRRSYKTSKPCKEDGDQPANQKFIRWISDLSGHL